MSLINDLAIELDRRRTAEGIRGDRASADLAPVPPVRGERNRWLPSPSSVWIVVGVAAATVVLRPPIESRLRGEAEEPGRPPVSARPAEPAPRPDADRPVVAATRALDHDVSTTPPGRRAPIEVLGVSLRSEGGRTRLVIETDERGRARIDGAGRSRELEIVLEEGRLGRSLDLLDLHATPIESWQTHAEDDGVRFRLGLEEVLRVQSQWIEEPDRARLVVELQAEPGETNGATVFSEEIASQGAPNADWAAVSRGREPRERELEIEPSAEDRRRRASEAAHRAASFALGEAHAARAEGRLEAADRLYAHVLETLPDHREATLDRAGLLVELGRQPEALSLVLRARRGSPDDTGLLMLHAQIVASTGDLQEGVAILDRAGIDPERAPEVEALAAAFLQRSGDHVRAIARYESLLRRAPGRPSWWMGLGISLEAMDRDREALDVYRIAMELGELPLETRRWVVGRVEALDEES